MNATLPGPIIAIIGGGVTGAAVAYHLAHSDTPGAIIIFEPRAYVGGGLAYSSEDPQHRINVPASKMSLIPGDDEHFVRWLAATGAAADDPESLGPGGHLYPRRSVFGRYINAHVAPLLDGRQLRQVKDTVVAVRRDGSNWSIETDSGLAVRADIVVIATTHPPPEPPSVLAAALSGDPRFIADATERHTLANIATTARVLVVGTGLTSADVIASLDAQGHGGPITALSRRGLRSRGHADTPLEPYGNFTEPAPATALALLRRVRATISEADVAGLPWQAVIDAVRAQAQTFWPQLLLHERRRIVRHLRPYWDVHRFRIAPQPEAIIERRQREGSLQIIAASLVSATATRDGVAIRLRHRVSRAVEDRQFDAIIVTTGPAHDRILKSQAYLSALERDGWIAQDAMGLGIACNTEARAIDRNGHAIGSLFIAGPLARGTFGELMGLPQVTEYAQRVASFASQLAISKLA